MQCVMTNLRGAASAQELNWDYTSMVYFNGERFGTNTTGLYEICCGQTDDGTAIDAYFILATTDFGIENNKHIRKVYVGLETTGSLILELTADGRTTRTYSMSTSVSGQQRLRIPIGRDISGRYWTAKISNVNGSDFSIDKIEVLPIVKSSGIR